MQDAGVLTSIHKHRMLKEICSLKCWVDNLWRSANFAPSSYLRNLRWAEINRPIVLEEEYDIFVYGPPIVFVHDDDLDHDNWV